MENNLGEAYLLGGDPRRAEAHFQRALAITERQGPAAEGALAAVYAHPDDGVIRSP